jgi:hypothetical protein
MADGIIFLDEEKIGTFTFEPWPNESIRFKFNEGLRVRETLEHATENGIPISLMVVPDVQEGD